MKCLFTLFKTELILSVREFSGVLFGLIMPVGIMLLLGVLHGDKPAYEGASFTLVQQSFAAVATIGICASGLMGIPLNIAAYREKKILKHFKVTPTSPFLLLGAQFLTNLVFAVLSSLLVFLVALLFFNYSLQGPLLQFILAYGLVLTAIFSLGMMIASVSGNIKTANLLCTIFYFPMLFLSGATIPFEIMPVGLQKVSSIMPLTQGIRLLKNVSLATTDTNWLKPVIILSATAVLGMIISVKTFRWE
ncbi:MAG: ABC transporter permease [Spirochaetales bacterium]|nr:ABC transporter permease [Spirochaetales bacterium]